MAKSTAGSSAKKTAAPASKTSKNIATKTRPAATATDWRTAMLDQVRALVRAADPSIVEERKWMKPTNPAGVPTWSSAGIVCTGETYKALVKCTFAQGAALQDPKGLFNASLDGNQRRAIDLREGDTLDATAFKALVRAAVALNQEKAASKKKPARTGKA